jgi:hypothetical protein
VNINVSANNSSEKLEDFSEPGNSTEVSWIAPPLVRIIDNIMLAKWMDAVG